MLMCLASTAMKVVIRCSGEKNKERMLRGGREVMQIG